MSAFVGLAPRRRSMGDARAGPGGSSVGARPLRTSGGCVWSRFFRDDGSGSRASLLWLELACRHSARSTLAQECVCGGGAGGVSYACVHVAGRRQSYSAKDMDTEGARNGDR